MLRKTLVSALTSAIALACATTANAEAFTAADMNIQFYPDGSISAFFGNSGIAAGEFTDTFTFTIPASGIGSGSVTTNTGVFEATNDTDLISVDVNGIFSVPNPPVTGVNEVAFVNDVPIVAFVLNTVTIKGFSRGNGSYGAQATFIPAAVPEPATWGMMIMGFALVGAGMRARRASTRFAFS